MFHGPGVVDIVIDYNFFYNLPEQSFTFKQEQKYHVFFLNCYYIFFLCATLASIIFNRELATGWYNKNYNMFSFEPTILMSVNYTLVPNQSIAGRFPVDREMCLKIEQQYSVLSLMSYNIIFLCQNNAQALWLAWPHVSGRGWWAVGSVVN